MVCPCCQPPSDCKVCDPPCQVGGTWSDQVGQNYFEKSEVGIEFLPELPESQGWPGSARFLQVWKYPRASSPFIPPITLPAFTWNEGYPARVEQCLYVFYDLAITRGLGDGCCRVIDNALQCDERVQAAVGKFKFRWRLMILDCEAESFVDVTDDAVTQTDPFEGELDQSVTPLDRDCDSVKWTATPAFFDDPIVVCP